MSVDPVVVAIVGYGYWGPNLLRNYAELSSASVKWVCDLDVTRRTRARKSYPSVMVTADYEDVLVDPNVDAIVIATPISTHYALAMRALKVGKHVFVEKPLTASVKECVELKRLAEKRDLTLMVGHTFIYSPPVRKIKDLIDVGELGEVRFVTMQRVNLGLHQKDVSVIWDLAAHDISILDYWLGEMPDVVVSMGRDCMRTGIPDVAFLSLQYRSGLVALVNVSWLSPVKLRGTVVVGSRKMLVYDDTAPVEKVKLFDHGVDFKEPASFAEFQMVYRTGDIVSPKIDNTEPLRLEAEQFLHCISTGRKPITDADMGLRVVAVLAAADAAQREGATKTVERRDGLADRRTQTLQVVDVALRESISRAIGRPERRSSEDRRLRVLASVDAGGSLAEGVMKTVLLPQRQQADDTHAGLLGEGALAVEETGSSMGA